MRFLGKLAFKLINLIVTFGFICYAVILLQAMLSGQAEISGILQCGVFLFIAYRIFRSRFCQSLLWHIITREPIQRLEQNMGRSINAFFDNQTRPDTAAEERARARAAAADKAAFHAYQARRNAGTYAGYQHENLAKKYRNDAR